MLCSVSTWYCGSPDGDGKDEHDDDDDDDDDDDVDRCPCSCHFTLAKNHFAASYQSVWPLNGHGILLVRSGIGLE